MSQFTMALITKPGIGRLLVGFGTVALLILMAACGDTSSSQSDTKGAADQGRNEERLVVVRVDTIPGVEDPFDSRWVEAPVIEVPVQAQVMTSPRLDEPTIEHVELQAMNDGQRIAWRLSWKVAEPSRLVDTSRFSDAVAVQFPLAAGAPPIMGSADRPVHILYWKAQWQHDVDQGFQDVQDLYPNFWSDLYWFVEKDYPYPIEEAFDDKRAHAWLSAHAVGNPMAQLGRSQPVQELMAEGFGTLTHYPTGNATGRGAWQSGRWAVVFERPLDADDELARRLAAGEVNQVALAVWDGAAGNVGGRKHWAMWVPMELQQ